MSDTLAALVKQWIQDLRDEVKRIDAIEPRDFWVPSLTVSMKLDQLEEALAAIVAQPPCPVCGNEERHPRTDLLTCECPAAIVAPQPEGWQPIETAPAGVEVLVKIGFTVKICYKTQPEPPMVQTWRLQNGEFAGWPTLWHPIPKSGVDRRAPHPQTEKE